MKILSRPRAAGKTYEAIMESARSGAVILCADQADMRRVVRMALDLGVHIPRPLTCCGIRDKMQGRRESVIVDNADYFFRMFVGADIHGITVTGPAADIQWNEAAHPTTSPGTPPAEASPAASVG